MRPRLVWFQSKMPMVKSNRKPHTLFVKSTLSEVSEVSEVSEAIEVQKVKQKNLIYEKNY